MNKNPLSAVLNIFTKLSIQQKVVIAGAVVATVLLLGALLFVLNEPNYTTLYMNLAQDDAAKVIEHLNAQKIQYKIDNNGSIIKVSKDKVYETRLSLASKGIPNSGVIGYEIFDKTTMGMSEFMQKLNFKRALEGELSRTIMQQDGVEGVRVHIVFPEKSVFKEEEKAPTASVVLKLSNNYALSKSNISAIVNLVSSSVEGLEPGKVTLIDTKGRLLSRETDDAGFGSFSGKQYEIKQNVENYLVRKAQSILDNVVGYGNSIVQVNADINFDQVEKTMEMFDPESQIEISEQSIKTENNGRGAGDSTAQSSVNTTTNYEISKTIQKVVEGTGNIKFLTVAVVISDVVREIQNGEEVTTITEPRPQEQITKLENILKNAVGFKEDRKDQFSIVSIPFETKPVEDVKVEETSFFDDKNDMLNIILMVAAIIASIFILKGLMSKLKNEKIIIGTVNPDEMDFGTYIPATSGKESKPAPPVIPKRRKTLLPVGDIEDEISDEAVMRKNQQEKIVNYVSKNPIDAAKLINSWLHEDESQ